VLASNGNPAAAAAEIARSGGKAKGGTHVFLVAGLEYGNVQSMPIRLTPKARVAILSGLAEHMARSDLRPICMAESCSTQAAEHHEPARAGS